MFFDQLVLRFTRGNLKEEAHYYPHGLPIAGMGSAAHGFVENRRKYQSNEYIKDLGLNWMDFQARQYDPQLGRFLAVDPLADAGGQDNQRYLYKNGKLYPLPITEITELNLNGENKKRQIVLEKSAH